MTAPKTAKQRSRKAKESALAAILPDIAADAQEIAQTDYAQHTMKRASASHTVNGALLDNENAAIQANAKVAFKFKIEISDAPPPSLNRRKASNKYDFWDAMIEAKRSAPDKFVSIKIPYETDADGRVRTMHSFVLDTNRRLVPCGYHFKCKDITADKLCIVWVEIGDYAPSTRAKTKVDPNNPVAHLSKKTRELYAALCAAKENEINEPGYRVGTWFEVNPANVAVPGLSGAMKQVLLQSLEEAGVLLYDSVGCVIKVA